MTDMGKIDVDRLSCTFECNVQHEVRETLGIRADTYGTQTPNQLQVGIIEGAHCK